MGGIIPVSGSDAILAVLLTFVFLKRGVATTGNVSIILVTTNAFVVVRGGRGSSSGGNDGDNLVCTTLSTVFTTLASVLNGVNVGNIRSGLNATVHANIILVVT